VAGYVNCPYTPDEWRDILKSASSQLIEMQVAVAGVRKMERRATAATPGYDIFPIDDDANAAMQTVMNAKWGNILGDIGAAASLALFRYRYVIAAGKPAAYLTATISDYSATQSKILANGGEPFLKCISGGANAGDRVTIRWTTSAGVVRTLNVQYVDSVATSNTLRLLGLLNADRLDNGDFHDADDWVFGAPNWSWDGSKAYANAITTEVLAQATGQVVAGMTYELTYTVSSYSAGDIRAELYGVTTFTGETRSANGPHTETFLAAALGSPTLQFHSPSHSFTGKIDNVSIREVMPSADDSVEVELTATYVP